MEQLIISSENTQVFKIVRDEESPLPKAKSTAIAFAMIAISVITFTANLNQGLHLTLSKNKTGFSKLIDNSDKKTRSVTISNGEEVASMSEVKLNEVQRYFDDKISKVVNSVHSIDLKVTAIETELKHINEKIDDIPNVIETTLLKIEEQRKGKWWDRYGGPVISGIIVAVITTAVPLLINYLNHK